MKRLFYIIPLMALVVSCSSYRYHTTKVQSADFSQYHTYGWLPPVDSLSKSFYNNDIAQSNIMETANKALEARGLTYTKENPDLLFRYIAIVNNKSRPMYAPMYGGFGPWGMGMWGYNPWMWHGGWGMGMGMGWNRPVGQERFRAGHIIIEAIDRETNSVIWQARGTGEVKNPERAINKLPEVVNGIIDQLPIQAKK